MTTTTAIRPQAARQLLSDAEAEKREAADLAAALADQVRDGDPDVKPADLSAARDLAEFADLRITAAQRKLAAAEDADRHARATEAATQARSIADQDDTAIADAVRTVADAVAHLAQLANDRQDRFMTVVRALADIDLELTAATGQPNQMQHRYGVRHQWEVIHVTAPDAEVRSVRPAELVAAAVSFGAGTLVPRADLSALVAAADSIAQRMIGALPALAAEWRLSDEQWAQLSPQARELAVQQGRRDWAPPTSASGI